MNSLENLTNTVFDKTEITSELKEALKNIDEKVSFMVNAGMTDNPYFTIHCHYQTRVEEIKGKYKDSHDLFVKNEAQKGAVKFTLALAYYLSTAKNVDEVILLYSALEKAGNIAYASEKEQSKTKSTECPSDAVIKFIQLMGRSVSGIEDEVLTGEQNKGDGERTKYLKFINYILEGKDEAESLRWNHIEQAYPLTAAIYAASRLNKAQYCVDELKDIVMKNISGESRLSNVASESHNI